MKKIGILYHPTRQDSLTLAQQVRDFLHEKADLWQGSVADEEALRRTAPQLDCLVTLGGDGTIVRAVRAVAAAGVPILGVNLGRLGFLAEVEPEQIEPALAAVLRGEYHLERRMMLRSTLRRAEQVIAETEAINDVVVARGNVSRTVQVAVDVDGHYVMTQTADGLIVSTPTGSTAYCLSAGGPIVAPDLNCITLTPIAAHLAVAHAIVIPAHRHLRLKLLKGQGAMLTVDGQVDIPLQPGDEVSSTASPNTAQFIRFGGDGYFYETILRRLRWPDQGPIP